MRVFNKLQSKRVYSLIIKKARGRRSFLWEIWGKLKGDVALELVKILPSVIVYCLWGQTYHG